MCGMVGVWQPEGLTPKSCRCNPSGCLDIELGRQPVRLRLNELGKQPEGLRLHNFKLIIQDMLPDIQGRKRNLFSDLIH